MKTIQESSQNRNKSQVQCFNFGANNMQKGNATSNHITVEQSLDKYIFPNADAGRTFREIAYNSMQPMSGCGDLDVGNGIQNLSIQAKDSLFAPCDSPAISNLCRAMKHLGTTDFADHVIKICNHITSLALNEIDSLCAGLQRTSLNEEHSITHEISVLCFHIRNLKTAEDMNLVVEDMSCKLSNLQFHDYKYNTFISINQLLTRLSSLFLSEHLSHELSQLKIEDPSFEDQYELTCRMLRYILTTMPAEGQVLATYMQQLRIYNCKDYY